MSKVTIVITDLEDTEEINITKETEDETENSLAEYLGLLALDTVVGEVKRLVDDESNHS